MTEVHSHTSALVFGGLYSSTSTGLTQRSFFKVYSGRSLSVKAQSTHYCWMTFSHTSEQSGRGHNIATGVCVCACASRPTATPTGPTFSNGSC